MVTKDLYSNKLKILSKDDFSGLINILNQNNINAIDNYDRTIAVDCNNEALNDILNKAILTWIDDSLTCPTEFLYNVFPINDNKFIIHI